MRRGTQSAELFGELLKAIRVIGLESPMAPIADKLGVPPATISQIEKGQRALKKPKISLWANAFGVNETDLHDLWMSCQGVIILENDDPLFYTDILGPNPINYLVEQIEDLLHSLLPNNTVRSVIGTSVSMPRIVFSPTCYVEIPQLERPGPIVRKRGKSLNKIDLESLITKLSGPERERVRGYIEAILEYKEP